MFNMDWTNLSRGLNSVTDDRLQSNSVLNGTIKGNERKYAGNTEGWNEIDETDREVNGEGNEEKKLPMKVDLTIT